MTFKTDMSSDLSVFFNTDEFAQSVTYTPKGGSGTSISAVFERDAPFQEAYVRGRETATGELAVKTDDVGTPQYGDTFTIGTEIWDYDAERGVIYEDDDVLVIGLIRRD